jgi:hypothetical protein
VRKNVMDQDLSINQSSEPPGNNDQLAPVPARVNRSDEDGDMSVARRNFFDGHLAAHEAFVRAVYLVAQHSLRRRRAEAT